MKLLESVMLACAAFWNGVLKTGWLEQLSFTVVIETATAPDRMVSYCGYVPSEVIVPVPSLLQEVLVDVGHASTITVLQASRKSSIFPKCQLGTFHYFSRAGLFSYLDDSKLVLSDWISVNNCM